MFIRTFESFNTINISTFKIIKKKKTLSTVKQNVLFLMMDDLRPELSVYGQSQISSPNIDALAKSGVTFKRAYCNVPVCGASRASILTGIRPTANRFLKFNGDHPDYTKWNNFKTQLENLDIKGLTYPYEKSLEKHLLDNSLTFLNPLQLP